MEVIVPKNLTKEIWNTGITNYFKVINRIMNYFYLIFIINGNTDHLEETEYKYLAQINKMNLNETSQGMQPINMSNINT